MVHDVAGTSDLILAGCLLALAWRPLLSLLFFYFVSGFIVAALINLPFVPEFAIVLAVTVPALATYPHWAELRNATSWWQRPRIVPLLVGGLATAAVVTLAVVAIGRQIGAPMLRHRPTGGPTTRSTSACSAWQP